MILTTLKSFKQINDLLWVNTEYTQVTPKVMQKEMTTDTNSTIVAFDTTEAITYRPDPDPSAEKECTGKALWGL